MQHEVYRHTKIPITVLREFLCSAYNLVLASSTFQIHLRSSCAGGRHAESSSVEHSGGHLSLFESSFVR